MVIDGVLDESIYTKVTPLKGAISSLYLVPMADALYIGVEVEDANINVATPMEFWNASLESFLPKRKDRRVSP